MNILAEIASQFEQAEEFSALKMEELYDKLEQEFYLVLGLIEEEKNEWDNP